MAYEDKSAYALCAFSFALGPDSEPITFLGKTLVYYSRDVAFEIFGLKILIILILLKTVI